MQKPDITSGVTPSTTGDRTAPARVDERGGSVNPAPSPGDRRPGKIGPIEKREEALDDALDDTFPGSDPVSISPKVPDRPKD